MLSNSIAHRNVYRYGAHVEKRAGEVRRYFARCLDKGQIVFSLGAVIEVTGLSRVAARAQIRRSGQVVPFSLRRGIYIIVPPEYRVNGAPPVDWWLDACFSHLGEPYYVGLLSAAGFHGSSHQAVQSVQIMISSTTPRRDMRIGRLHLKFFQKSGVEKTPAFEPSPAYAPMKVSTVGATMFDLVKYAPRLGGLGRVGEVISDLPAKVDSLREALAVGQEIPTVQRLGYLLDEMKRPNISDMLVKWLASRTYPPVPLLLGSPIPEKVTSDNRWRIINNTPRKNLI
ncbi:MAG: type IV toxin-antitoxin system AbiEi family antitoxin domain-containing protein [Terrimicrobiaceae bacterium]